MATKKKSEPTPEPEPEIQRITELTPEQEALLDVVRDEWLAYGLSCEPADRAAAEEGVRAAYEAAGLTPPKHYIWVNSPYAGAIALGCIPQVLTKAFQLIEDTVQKAVDGPSGEQDLRVSVTDTPLEIEAVRDWWRSSTYGQHSAGYYAYLDAMERLGIKGLEKIHGAMKVAKSAGWWWPAEEFVILTERPRELHRDAQLRPHHETGPAIVYPDGWAVYVWHGTRVPKELILDMWTPEDILRETNTEVRRCAIEKMGWDRFVKEAKLQQVGEAADDPANPGFKLELYDLPEQLYDTPVRVLLCNNATIERDGTRRRFGLTVDANCKDPVEAAAWTFSLTKAEYLELQRAT